jgi:hypothetical protein
MGEIIHSKSLPNKRMIYKVLIEENEMKNLQGHLKNVRVFSSKLCNKTSEINTRGNGGVTKYFKIPLSIRSRRKQNHGILSSQRLETPKKIFYIYVVDKEINKEKI